ncbi:MAG: hypothetical protein ACI30M_00645 [Muribaculaceae bacterium]
MHHVRPYPHLSILYSLFSILYSLFSILYPLPPSGRLGEPAVMRKDQARSEATTPGHMLSTYLVARRVTFYGINSSINLKR